MEHQFMNKFVFWFIWIGDVMWVILLTLFLIVYGLLVFLGLPLAVLVDHILFRIRLKKIMKLGIPKEVILLEYNHKYWKKLGTSYSNCWSDYKKVFNC